MKKRMKKTASDGRGKPRRAGVVGIAGAIAVLAVGAMAAVSIRSVNSRSQAGKAENSMTKSSNPTRLAMMNGQVVGLDAQTGQYRPLTAEEQQKLASGIAPLVNQSDEGLKQVQRPGGAVSMNLEGRFQNVSVAQKNEDGSISQSCVNSPETAAAFFGMDPEQFGAKTKGGKSANQPVSRNVPGKGEVK
jgi:hypothetical protein